MGLRPLIFTVLTAQLKTSSNGTAEAVPLQTLLGRELRLRFFDHGQHFGFHGIV
jgi:hypothetical protein